MISPSSGTPPPARKRVVILGATGSIGESALRVLRAHPDRLELVGIAACRSAAKLAAVAREFGVRHVALYDEGAYREAKASRDGFPPGTRLVGGLAGLTELACLPDADLILVAVVGTAALEPALAALACGKSLALASKEILVMAGRFVTEAARASGARILPVDSEHNAIFQCLQGHAGGAIRRICLTASGGALRDWPIERLAHATPADALRHPNWAMGPKITIDSATLANKGLELIEAQWLFGLTPEQCDAILHPQSIVHGLVEFQDGSLLAQLCPPSMTFPIQNTLLFPDRLPGPDATLDFTRLMSLDFRPVDTQRFPMLGLARHAMRTGGVAPAVFNAANEVAVAAFLSGEIPFLAISHVVEQTLTQTDSFEPNRLADILAADEGARRAARAMLAEAAAASRSP